jgi:hypothetical protein
VLVAAILGVVAVLGLTTPARHDEIEAALPVRSSRFRAPASRRGSRGSQWRRWAGRAPPGADDPPRRWRWPRSAEAWRWRSARSSRSIRSPSTRIWRRTRPRTVRRVNRPGRAALPGPLPGLPRSGRLGDVGGRGSPRPADQAQHAADHGRRPLVGHARNSDPGCRSRAGSARGALGRSTSCGTGRPSGRGSRAVSRPRGLRCGPDPRSPGGEDRALRDWRGRWCCWSSHAARSTTPRRAEPAPGGDEAARWRDHRRVKLVSRRGYRAR